MELELCCGGGCFGGVGPGGGCLGGCQGCTGPGGGPGGGGSGAADADEATTSGSSKIFTFLGEGVW